MALAIIITPYCFRRPEFINRGEINGGKALQPLLSNTEKITAGDPGIQASDYFGGRSQHAMKKSFPVTLFSASSVSEELLSWVI